MDMPPEILAEAEALLAAPLLDLSQGQSVPRCHFCGRISQSLTFVDVIGGIERHAGDCCRGNT